MAETRRQCSVKIRMEKWMLRMEVRPDILCTRMGYAPGYWRSTPVPNISFIERFLEYYPQLSAEYIMRGIGDIERSANEEAEIDGEKEKKEEIDKPLIKSLEERIKDKDVIIELLQKQLAIYENLIQTHQ